MKSSKIMSLLLTAGFVLAGCAQLSEVSKEVPKAIWGSSTRALENARVEAHEGTFRCELDECFDAVLALTESFSPFSKEVMDSKPFKLFLQDRPKRQIVVMGAPGVIGTTEVGVFFIDLGSGKLRIEVASLSRAAQRNTAEIIFLELGKQYQTVEE